MSREPHFGRTRRGAAVHLHAADHQPAGTAYERFNKKVALGVTGFVGSMTAAWLFCLLALLSLPAVLTQAFSLHFFPHWLVAVGLIALVAWIAQTFLQLVLLSVIMVGQNVQQAAGDARAAKTFEDAEVARADIRTALDLLDTRTEGGLADVLAAVHACITMTGHVLDVMQPARAPAAPAAEMPNDRGRSTVTTLFRAGGVSRGLPELTPAPTVYLADVSEFQPDIADAAYLAWSKAIAVRALYGDAHDDAAWYGGARRADLHAGGVRFLGIYQFLLGSQSGAAQAQAFHSLVGSIRPGEVFIADFEQGAHQVLTSWYNEMLALYGQGIAPYLWTYTGLDFGQSSGALPVEWIAYYGATEPASPHKLWQFSDAYTVPGVGAADCSLFHGTIGELAALAYPAAASAS